MITPSMIETKQKTIKKTPGKIRFRNYRIIIDPFAQIACFFRDDFLFWDSPMGFITLESQLFEGRTCEMTSLHAEPWR